MSSSLVLGFNNMSSCLCLPLSVFGIFSTARNKFLHCCYVLLRLCYATTDNNLVFAIFFIRVCISKCLNIMYVVKLFTALMHYLPSLTLKYVRVCNHGTFPPFLEFKIL